MKEAKNRNSKRLKAEILDTIAPVWRENEGSQERPMSRSRPPHPFNPAELLAEVCRRRDEGGIEQTRSPETAGCAANMLLVERTQMPFYH